MPGNQASAKIIHVHPASACETCSVRRLCLPVTLDGNELDSMADILKTRSEIGGGDFIYHPGDPFASLFAIKKGSIKTYGLTSDGREQITGFHLAGELVGMDAIGTNVHSCAAVALEPTEVCELPYGQLEEISHRVTGLQHELSRIMSREIAQGGRMLLMIGKLNAEQRVACFLEHIYFRLHQLGGETNVIHLPMSREDIGNYLGLTLETVSRRLGALQNQGILRLEKRDVHILDMGKLKELCAI